MNRERAKELLPILGAFVEGKDIQFRLIDPQLPNTVHWWCDLPKNEDLTITFPADDYEYRIKPKPREWSFYLDRYGAIVKILDENDLIMVLRGDKPDDSILVKVREVIPNEGK